MDSVTLEREFPVPQSRLWRALTLGALLAEWLMENDFQPVHGHRFTFRTKPVPYWDGVVQAEVLEIVPETLLVLQWNSGALQTKLRFTLTPTASGVRLHLEQTGFRPDQVWNRDGAATGWPRNLDRLASLLVKEF